MKDVEGSSQSLYPFIIITTASQYAAHGLRTM